MSKAIKILLSLIVVAAGLFAGSTANAVAAPAVHSKQQEVQTVPIEMLRSFAACPNGVGCVFADETGTGLYIPLAFSYYGWSCWNFPEHGFANDDNESAVNRYGSGLRLRFYSDAGCSGYSSTVANNGTADWLWLSHLWNAASSFQILSAA